MKLLRKKMNKKGFSLIELIVVIAILAIIAAIAIPRFAVIQANSEVKSDVATAAEIVNMCRLQEVETGDPVTSLAQSVPAVAGELLVEYMIVPESQSYDGTAADDFALIVKDGVGNYRVTFEPNNGSSKDGVVQTIVENVKYDW